VDREFLQRLLRVTARYTHPGSRAADVSNLRVNSWPAPTATAAA
jgi:hypothetical protein